MRFGGRSSVVTEVAGNAAGLEEALAVVEVVAGSIAVGKG